MFFCPVQSTRRSDRCRRFVKICWVYGLLSPDPVAIGGGASRPPRGDVGVRGPIGVFVNNL